MLGMAGVKPNVENDQFVPIEADGLAMLSIGNLIETDNTPIAWRGVKATGALMQMYNQTNWPNLDYLIIDMPPGTGDITLTLAQRIPVTGVVVVTTPQHIALLDAKKALRCSIKLTFPYLVLLRIWRCMYVASAGMSIISLARMVVRTWRPCTTYHC